MTKLLQDLPAARKASAEAQAKVKAENAKHTPGPWTLTGSGGQWESRLSIRADKWGCIAQIGVDPQMPHWDGPQRANARLIAAAPELLEALIAMEREKSDYMRLNHLGDPSNETTNKLARAAIAKAQGEPHE